MWLGWVDDLADGLAKALDRTVMVDLRHVVEERRSAEADPSVRREMNMSGGRPKQIHQSVGRWT